ncbi:hypothetical protein LguiA_029688 [Lonicera macranthoides]
MDKMPNRLEEQAHGDASCLILLQISAATENLSSNILAFLSCHMHHGKAKQLHLHDNFIFFLFPLKCHSIPRKSCHEQGIAPITSNSSPTLFHM